MMIGVQIELRRRTSALLISVAVLLCPQLASAETELIWRAGVAGAAAIPVGGMAEEAGLGYGGTIKFDYFLGKTTNLAVRTGYVRFGTTEVGEADLTGSAIPFLAGVGFVFPGDIPVELFLEGGANRYVRTTTTSAGEEADSTFGPSGLAGWGFIYNDLHIGALVWLPKTPDRLGVTTMFTVGVALTMSKTTIKPTLLL